MFGVGGPWRLFWGCGLGRKMWVVSETSRDHTWNRKGRCSSCMMRPKVSEVRVKFPPNERLLPAAPPYHPHYHHQDHHH